MDITKNNFDKEVLNSKTTVIVDFWATWCGPCKMLSPILEKVGEKYKDSVKICKVNVDDEGELALTFDVMSIPTLIVFKNGEIIDKSIGLLSEDELDAFIKKSI